MASLEAKLQKELRKLKTDPVKAKVILPRYLSVLATEEPLFSAVQVITKDTSFSLPEKTNTNGVIGRIDVLFKYRSTNYVCEIKDGDSEGHSFWYATKALAYCEYYKWQTDNTHFRPAVIVPLQNLKLEHQLISGKLDIKLFVFTLRDDGFFIIKEVSDLPHWKQNL